MTNSFIIQCAWLRRHVYLLFFLSSTSCLPTSSAVFHVQTILLNTMTNWLCAVCSERSSKFSSLVWLTAVKSDHNNQTRQASWWLMTNTFISCITFVSVVYFRRGENLWQQNSSSKKLKHRFKQHGRLKLQLNTLFASFMTLKITLAQDNWLSVVRSLKAEKIDNILS